MVIFGDIGLQMHIPTEEELQGATILANTFIERLKKQPELMPSVMPNDVLSFIEERPKAFEAKHEFVINLLSKSEVYFRYKEYMAQKGINIYDTYLENIWSSDQVKLERANKFINYLRTHPALLPEGMTSEMLEQPELIKKDLDDLSRSWSRIYALSLSGIIINSPNQFFYADSSSSSKGLTWGVVLKGLLSEFMLKNAKHS